MGKHFLSMKDFNEQLQAMVEKRIEVIKTEQKDVDDVHILLERVDYDKDLDTLDEYEAENTIQLHGMGTIHNDDGEPEPLPSRVFEIPLDHNTMREHDGDELILSTERAVYKIKALD